MLKFRVENVKEFKNGNAGFTLIITTLVDNQEVDIFIYGCSAVKYNSKYFVSFPSYKGANGKYYNNAYVKLTDEETDAIVNSVFDSIVDEAGKRGAGTDNRRSRR